MISRTQVKRWFLKKHFHSYQLKIESATKLIRYKDNMGESLWVLYLYLPQSHKPFRVFHCFTGGEHDLLVHFLHIWSTNVRAFVLSWLDESRRKNQLNIKHHTQSLLSPQKDRSCSCCLWRIYDSIYPAGLLVETFIFRCFMLWDVFHRQFMTNNLHTFFWSGSYLVCGMSIHAFMHANFEKYNIMGKPS